MKIHIYYKITEKPWGGGNSFLKAFRKECTKQNVEICNNINGDYQILFANAAHRAPGRLLSTSKIASLQKNGVSNFWYKFLKRKPKLFIYRSDGFRDEYTGVIGDPVDEIQKKCLFIADHVVFQNNSCLTTARRSHIGYEKSNYSVIFNGVDQELFSLKSNFWDGKRKLKVFSANWSKNLNKGYKIISEFSLISGVECTFAGRWPEEVNPNKVKLLSAMKQEELAKEYRKHDVFLHPSLHDQSPNVCLEALSCGLPIFYHPTSGIKELAENCGVEINKESINDSYNVMKKKYQSFVETIKQKRGFLSITRCAEQYLDLFRRITENDYRNS